MLIGFVLSRTAGSAGPQGRLAEARSAKVKASEGWPTDNRDLAGTRYSPLTQINTTNVATLKEAATDPELGYIFVNSKDEPTTGWIAPRERRDARRQEERRRYMGKSGTQYVAVVAATQGQGNNESLHVFALPSSALRASEDRP